MKVNDQSFKYNLINLQHEETNEINNVVLLSGSIRFEYRWYWHSSWNWYQSRYERNLRIVSYIYIYIYIKFTVINQLYIQSFFLVYSRFRNSPGINFAAWMGYAVPTMIIMGLLTWLWLQIMYMGLFRSQSDEAKAIDIGKEGENVATRVIEAKYQELGPITWHESVVGVMFLSIVLLWFFRKPDFIDGWPTYITDL